MKRAPGYTPAQCGLMRWLDNMATRSGDAAYSARATEAALLRQFGKGMEELSDTECATARALFPGRE